MTTTTHEPPTPDTRTTASPWRVLALAMGGFAIGTTEFMAMGLLPQVADGVDVLDPAAGHLISAYALGVVVGAPVLAFLGARLPRRGLLVALMVAVRRRQRAQRAGRQLRAAPALAVPRRRAARRLLRRRVPRRRQPGSARPRGSRGRDGDDRSLGRQRRRRPGRHLDGPAPRLALGLLGRPPALAVLTAALVVLFIPACPGDADADRPPRAAAVRRARRRG